MTNELVSQFLGQNIRSNTIELKYDITHRVSAYLGYMYTARTIADFSATFDTGEIYFPGGAGGTRLSRGLDRELLPCRARRLRRRCGRRSAFRLHAERRTVRFRKARPRIPCRKPATTPRGTSTIFMKMRGCSASRRVPTDNLRINADLMFGYNDNSFTRISPRQLQSYKIQCALHSHALGERQRRRGHSRESGQRLHRE